MVGTLASGIDSLENLQDIEESLMDLGLKHAKMGIRPEHYSVIGKALLNTMRAGLKDEYDKEINMSWREVYNALSIKMISNFHEDSDILTNEITEHKISLIRESWEKVKAEGHAKIGKDIFKNLFDLDPDLMDLFSFTDLSDFYESHEFQNHVDTIAKLVTKVVDNLEHMEGVMIILNQLGASHVSNFVKR